MESVKLEDIYNKLKEIERNMVTKEEISGAMESVLILSNEDTLSQIESSEKDIRDGRLRKIESVGDL